MSQGDRAEEMNELLEEVSYALTSARTSGLQRVDEMRSALKRAREAIVSAESLAADIVMVRRREEEDR